MIMKRQSQKETGAYYTPDSVVASLMQWVCGMRRTDARSFLW